MLNRANNLQRLQTTESWDIVVIGGGATGLGIAVDAAQRGYRVVLLEKNDFAKGTSSKSTKLVHGGVRYLAQGNLTLVMEALRERGYLLKNAPHLTKVQHFVIPVYSWFHLCFYGLGLLIYDLLAGKWSLGRTKILSRGTTLDHLPGIRQEGIKGGILYSDGQFDDARLAISLAQTATNQGAVVLNYFPVTKFLKNKDKIVGVEALDTISKQVYQIRTAIVINATGVFVDRIRTLDDPDVPPMVMPSQGVHLVIPKHFFPGREALMIPKTKDGRVLFAVPWQGVVIIGTTDTPLDTISDDPIALEAEVDFILDQFNRYREKYISRAAVHAVFAGLRPLVRTTTPTSKASRDHTLIHADSGLLSIVGGKWTTYRKMAQDAVDQAAVYAGLPSVQCQTQQLRLHGYTLRYNADDPRENYGSDKAAIERLIAKNPALRTPLHPDYPHTEAEVIWAVRNEMALQVEDILARRCRLLVADARAALAAAPRVAALMAHELGYDKQWEQQQIAAFSQLASSWRIN